MSGRDTFWDFVTLMVVAAVVIAGLIYLASVIVTVPPTHDDSRPHYKLDRPACLDQ